MNISVLLLMLIRSRARVVTAVHAENKPEDTLVSRFIGMSAVDVIMAAVRVEGCRPLTQRRRGY